MTSEVPSLHPTFSLITMAKAYKALKEDFVSNHSGGTISEINYVTAVAPVRGGVFIM